MKRVRVVYVLYNTVSTHGKEIFTSSILSVSNQESYSLGVNLSVSIYDNASTDSSGEFAKTFLKHGISFYQNSYNLGFGAGYNKAFESFVRSDDDYVLLLNADAVLAPTCILHLVESFCTQSVGITCPRLLMTENGELDYDSKIDAYGMYFSKSLRHFDRGAGKLQATFPDTDQSVFGASGACMMLSKQCLLDLVIERTTEESGLYSIYPFLAEGLDERCQVFDEAFMAYREDADLAWRAQMRGWCTLLVQDAVGAHRRVVRPERRGTLDPRINYWSVRNRFLMQINNYRFSHFPEALLFGVCLRNMLVLIGIVLRERSSLRALKDLYYLWKRAMLIRKQNREKTRVSSAYMRALFRGPTYA